MINPMTNGSGFGAGFPWTGPSYQPQQQVPVYVGGYAAGYTPGFSLQPGQTSLSAFFGPSYPPAQPYVMPMTIPTYGYGGYGQFGPQGGYQPMPISPYLGGTPNFPQGVMPYWPSSGMGNSAAMLGNLSQWMGALSPRPTSVMPNNWSTTGTNTVNNIGLNPLLGGLGANSALLNTTSINALLNSLLGAAAPAATTTTGGLSQANINALLASLKPTSTATTATTTNNTDLNKLLASLLGTGSTTSTTTNNSTDLNKLLASLLGTGSTTNTTTNNSTDLNKLLASLLGSNGSNTDLNALLKALGLNTAASPTVAGPTPVATSSPTPTTTTTTTTPTATTTNPTTVTTGQGPTNLAWGDPHFVYNHNGKKLQFDFQGIAGFIYNLFRDGAAVNINAKFKAWKGHKGATVMESFGFDLNGKKLEFVKGKATLDGKVLEKNQVVEYDTGIAIPDKPGETYKGTIKFDGKDLTVNTGEYIFKAIDQGAYMDLEGQVTNIGTRANGLDSVGVKGETYDIDHKNYGKGGKTGANAQGEGYLNFGGNEGKAYLADNLFDTQHQYTEDKHDVKLGVGTNQKGKGTK